MITKTVAVWPTAGAFRLRSRDRTHAALLMATGLTFGSISALYGLTNGLVTQRQYSVLVTVVILSAFVPTLIAQRWFSPTIEDAELEETISEEDLAFTHSRHGTDAEPTDAGTAHPQPQARPSPR